MIEHQNVFSKYQIDCKNVSKQLSYLFVYFAISIHMYNILDTHHVLLWFENEKMNYSDIWLELSSSFNLCWKLFMNDTLWQKFFEWINSFNSYFQCKVKVNRYLSVTLSLIFAFVLYLVGLWNLCLMLCSTIYISEEFAKHSNELKKIN